MTVLVNHEYYDDALEMGWGLVQVRAGKRERLSGLMNRRERKRQLYSIQPMWEGVAVIVSNNYILRFVESRLYWVNLLHQMVFISFSALYQDKNIKRVSTVSGQRPI